MSGPPRPRCRFCDWPNGRSDCDLHRGIARALTGDEFHPDFFGTDPFPYTAYPGQSRDARREPADGGR